MKRILFVLSSVVALASAAVDVPYNMYVEPGTNSCLVTWEDDDNSAWNLRYRLFSEDNYEPVMLHSITASSYTGSYNDITLPAPWGGTNVRGGRSEIYFRNNYNNNGSYGNITYTIPDGYNHDTFTLMVTTYSSNSNGAGNLTVATPNTAAVTHNFSAGDTYYWVVIASSGEKITITTPDSQYSPSIALMAVYQGDATDSKKKTTEWTYVYDLVKTRYTIEDLEMSTDYEVQVQAVGADGTYSNWCRPDVFTTLDEEPIIPSVHIMGEIDDQAWAPDAGTKMEYNPATESYTATVHAEAGASFGFTTELDDNGEMGGWNYILPYRFGPESEGEFYLTDERLGQSLELSFDQFSDVYVLKTGDYEITVSLEHHYIIIGKIEPEFIIGDVNKDGQVNVSDVTTLISAILNSTTTIETDHFNPAAANVNGDDAINVSDVTTLITMILTAGS